MAGNKGLTSAQAEAARKKSRPVTAIQRGQDGGKVSAYAGKAQEKKPSAVAKESVNADEIKAKAAEAAKKAAKAEAEAKQKEKDRKAKEDEDYKKRNEAAKKKSAIDQFMRN